MKTLAMTYFRLPYCGIVLLLVSHLNFLQAQSHLNFCSDANPDAFNPMLSTTTATMDATTDTIYSQLMQLSTDSATLDLQGGLALSYDINHDGTEYRLKLRPNVKFHSNQYFTPTRPFNAHDVLFTFQRQQDASHPYHKVSQGTYLYFQRYLEGLLKEVIMIDEMTVVFRLHKADSQFLYYLALANNSILSAEYADKMLANQTPHYVDQYPIGTGPFQWVSYQKDQLIRYQAFDEYWEGKPAIDQLNYIITPDSAVRVAKLLRQECDVIAPPNPMDLAGIQPTDTRIQLLKKNTLNTAYLAFNTEKPPFDQPEVRLALAEAINRPAIVKAIYNDFALLAQNILPPGMKFINLALDPYPYNPIAAKKRLEATGFSEGLTIDLWAMPLARPYNPNPKRMAEMIQADWAAIGVKTNIKTFEWSEYLSRARAGEHQAILLGWSALTNEPENFLETLFACKQIKSGSNYARFCNENYETLLQTTLNTHDDAQRQIGFFSLQQQLREQMPLLPLAHTVVIQPIAAKVKNFKVSPYQHHDFKKVYIETASPEIK